MKSWDGKQHILVIVDQYSRFLWAYPVSAKSDAAGVIKKWHLYARNQAQTELKTFQTERGGEILRRELTEWWDSFGVEFDYSLADTPQQNGLAERNNQSIMMKLRAVMIHMDLPDSWWTMASPLIVYLRNILPSAHLPRNTTPFLRLYNHPPDISMIRVFGCMCVYKVPEGGQGKLQPRACWGIHVGLCNKSKGWRVLDVASRKLTDSRNVYFYEDMSFARWNQRYNGQSSEVPMVSDSEFSNWPALNSPLPYTLTPPKEAESLTLGGEQIQHPHPPGLIRSSGAGDSEASQEELSQAVVRLTHIPGSEELGEDPLQGRELTPSTNVLTTGRSGSAWPRELLFIPVSVTPPDHVSTREATSVGSRFF